MTLRVLFSYVECGCTYVESFETTTKIESYEGNEIRIDEIWRTRLAKQFLGRKYSDFKLIDFSYDE